MRMGGFFVGVGCFLLAARLFTGIVYEYDDPTTYLVLKHRPSLVIEQQNGPSMPVRAQFTVIDGDENQLFYQPVYDFLMQWAFGLVALFLLLAYISERKRV